MLPHLLLQCQDNLKVAGHKLFCKIYSMFMSFTIIGYTIIGVVTTSNHYLAFVLLDFLETFFTSQHQGLKSVFGKVSMVMETYEKHSGSNILKDCAKNVGHK